MRYALILMEEMGIKLTEKELLVRKIENGIVVDHIPAEKSFLVLKFLKIDPKAKVVVATNVDSTKYGKKDIIKIEGRYLTSKEIDLISLVAPTATIDYIENWKVKKKHKVKLPDVIKGVFKCPNLFCSTNNEYKPQRTKFKVLSTEGDIRKTMLQCSYCNSFLYYGTIVDFLTSNAFSLEGGLVSREKIEKTFLDILIKKGALKIASDQDELFILQSGRPSPYFINMGALTEGESLAKIKWAFASYIALLLEEKKLDDFDFVFGPAYKGISLASLICEGLNELFGMQKRYMYDRKEEKVYGDKTDRVIVGAEYFKPGQRILIVDDVITTGRTKVKALEKLKQLGEHEVVGMVVAVDRQEKMGDAIKVENKSAVDYLQDKFGFRVYSVLNIQSIFNLIKDKLTKEMKRSWIEYYEKYGAIKLR